MDIILFNKYHNELMPFTSINNVADIRIGILTIREKWEYYLEKPVQFFLENHFEDNLILSDNTVFVDSSYLPSEQFVDAILKLEKNQAIYYRDKFVAVRTGKHKIDYHKKYNSIPFTLKLKSITNKNDIFLLNREAIMSDFKIITKDKISKKSPPSTYVFGNHPFFIEDAEHIAGNVSFNTEQGPIYVGKNVTIMEGALLRGPLAICEGSVIKMGAKIYGATTVGPCCKIGGEVKNSIFFGYSNKGHEGYLGDSVIGRWCNFGADSNASNMKNNYSEIRQWSYQSNSYKLTGLQFCGLMMGDYSTCAINTSFNTGSVVGIFCNIFGENPSKFTPDFTWGKCEYNLEKAILTAQRTKQMKGFELSEKEMKTIRLAFENTQLYREQLNK